MHEKRKTRELVTTSGLELLVVKLFEKLLVVKLTKIENGCSELIGEETE